MNQSLTFALVLKCSKLSVHHFNYLVTICMYSVTLLPEYRKEGGWGHGAGGRG